MTSYDQQFTWTADDITWSDMKTYNVHLRDSGRQTIIDVNLHAETEKDAINEAKALLPEDERRRVKTIEAVQISGRH